MHLIRKFVVGTGLAAGIFTIAAIAVPVQAREASTAPAVSQFSPSPACASAVNALKAAAAADRSEDLAEWHLVKAEGISATDSTEDAAERANFVSLFKAVRTACLPAGTATTFAPKAFTPSAQCTAAIRALKAAWAHGRPTTFAEWRQLQLLAQAARVACGWGFAVGR